MTILNALLIDGLKRHPDGRVDLLGLYEDIHLPNLPAAIESLSIFVDLAFDPDERGNPMALALHLLDPDGNCVHQSSIKFTVPTVEQYPRDTAQLDLALFTPTFHAHGPHRLEIHHDETLLRSLPLHILP